MWEEERDSLTHKCTKSHFRVMGKVKMKEILFNMRESGSSMVSGIRSRRCDQRETVNLYIQTVDTWESFSRESRIIRYPRRSWNFKVYGKCSLSHSFGRRTHLRQHFLYISGSYRAKKNAVTHTHTNTHWRGRVETFSDQKCTGKMFERWSECKV